MTGTHDKVKRYSLSDVTEEGGWPGMAETDFGAWVRAEDYYRLAALMPRTWDAETIKDAPGYSDINFDTGDVGSPERNYRIKYTDESFYREGLATLASVIIFIERGMISHAFGPLPTPTQE